MVVVLMYIMQIHEVMSKVCNLGVERHFWYKDGAQRSPATTRATSVVEVFLVGFHGPAGATSRAPFQCNFTSDGDVAENIHLVGKVLRPLYYNHKVLQTDIDTCDTLCVPAKKYRVTLIVILRRSKH